MCVCVSVCWCKLFTGERNCELSLSLSLSFSSYVFYKAIYVGANSPQVKEIVNCHFYLFQHLSLLFVSALVIFFCSQLSLFLSLFNNVVTSRCACMCVCASVRVYVYLKRVSDVHHGVQVDLLKLTSLHILES